MTSRLSDNTQAILLLTQPLHVGKRGQDGPAPLTTAQYDNLAKLLYDNHYEPADLLGSGVMEVLRDCGLEAYEGALARLLDRGFLLSLALEQWLARAIWVVSRADTDYPKVFKETLRADAPAVLYGRGNKALLKPGGLLVAGPPKCDAEELLRFSYDVGGLAADSEYTVLSGSIEGVGRAALGGAMDGGGTAIALLAGELDKAVLDSYFIPGFASRRLVMFSPIDPSFNPTEVRTVAANRLAYALADAALVVDAKRGATWKAIQEQLFKQSSLPVYVRQCAEPNRSLASLQRMGALTWPNQTTKPQFRELMKRVNPSGLSGLFAPATDHIQDKHDPNAPSDGGQPRTKEAAEVNPDTPSATQGAQASMPRRPKRQSPQDALNLFSPVPHPVVRGREAAAANKAEQDEDPTRATSSDDPEKGSTKAASAKKGKTSRVGKRGRQPQYVPMVKAAPRQRGLFDSD